jgi:hypothetical protein
VLGIRWVRPMWCASVAAGITAALSGLIGCSSVVSGSAVRAPGDAGAATSTRCQTVAAPMETIDAQAPGEPQLRIPQPPGWRRFTMLDSQLVRYAMANRDLIAQAFAPNVVVGLESGPVTDAQTLLRRERSALTTLGGATNVVVKPATVCGYPAESVTYTAPRMGGIASRRATLLDTVGSFGGKGYVASVTIQTTDPDNPTYLRDAQTILTGFQMLPPDEH